MPFGTCPVYPHPGSAPSYKIALAPSITKKMQFTPKGPLTLGEALASLLVKVPFLNTRGT
eukprot:1146712-Pelagomonas_calceolata.AAC.1